MADTQTTVVRPYPSREMDPSLAETQPLGETPTGETEIMPTVDGPPTPPTHELPQQTPATVTGVHGLREVIHRAATRRADELRDRVGRRAEIERQAPDLVSAKTPPPIHTARERRQQIRASRRRHKRFLAAADRAMLERSTHGYQRKPEYADLTPQQFVETYDDRPPAERRAAIATANEILHYGRQHARLARRSRRIESGMDIGARLMLGRANMLDSLSRKTRPRRRGAH